MPYEFTEPQTAIVRRIQEVADGIGIAGCSLCRVVLAFIADLKKQIEERENDIALLIGEISRESANPTAPAEGHEIFRLPEPEAGGEAVGDRDSGNASDPAIRPGEDQVGVEEEELILVDHDGEPLV